MGKFLDEVGLTHYNSKLLVRLNSKQCKLTGRQGQTVGFNAAGEASAQSGWNNRNLLDNAYWKIQNAIINQRGQTEYQKSGYCIDRWALYSPNNTARLTIRSGLTFTTAAEPCEFTQKFEEASGLDGRELCISILVNGQVYSASGIATVGEIHASFPLGFIELRRANLVSPYIVRLHINANAVVDVAAVKLEIGTVQTLTYQDAEGNWVLNDPPPDKTLELAKCERYQYKIKGTYYALAVGNSKISVSIPLKVRINPSIADLAITWIRPEGGSIEQPKAEVVGTYQAASTLTISIDILNLEEFETTKFAWAQPLEINFSCLADANL